MSLSSAPGSSICTCICCHAGRNPSEVAWHSVDGWAGARHGDADAVPTTVARSARGLPPATAIRNGLSQSDRSQLGMSTKRE